MVSQLENGGVGILATESLLLNHTATLALHELTKVPKELRVVQPSTGLILPQLNGYGEECWDAGQGTNKQKKMLSLE